MTNDDNLKSIILASMTRGTGKELDSFLETQKAPMPKRSTKCQDVGMAQKALTDFLDTLNNHAGIAKLETLREALREAHRKNEAYIKNCGEDERRYKVAGRNGRMRQSQGIILKKRDKRDRYDYMDNMPDMEEEDWEEMLWKKEEAATIVGQVYLPEFTRKEPIDEFKGSCMLCHRSSVLALVLKAPPSFQTPNFPAQGSYSKLAFPLALGSFAELDVMSYFVCCDCCAYYLVHNGVSPEGETIISALCLTGISDNQGVWLERLETAVRGRFDIKDLWGVYLALLDKMLTDNDLCDAPMDAKSLFHNAGSWVVQQLRKITQVPSKLSSSFDDVKALRC